MINVPKMEMRISNSDVHKAANAETLAKSCSLFDCPDESFAAETHATMKAIPTSNYHQYLTNTKDAYL